MTVWFSHEKKTPDRSDSHDDQAHKSPSAKQAQHAPATSIQTTDSADVTEPEQQVSCNDAVRPSQHDLSCRESPSTSHQTDHHPQPDPVCTTATGMVNTPASSPDTIANSVSGSHSPCKKLSHSVDSAADSSHHTSSAHVLFDQQAADRQKSHGLATTSDATLHQQNSHGTATTSDDILLQQNSAPSAQPSQGSRQGNRQAATLAEGHITKPGCIFVSVAAYRDPECQWTISDLFKQADAPELVHVGVVWQVDAVEDAAFVRVAGPNKRHRQVGQQHSAVNRHIIRDRPNIQGFPDGCQQLLLRLRPDPVRGHWLL